MLVSHIFDVGSSSREMNVLHLLLSLTESDPASQTLSGLACFIKNFRYNNDYTISYIHTSSLNAEKINFDLIRNEIFFFFRC